MMNCHKTARNGIVMRLCAAFAAVLAPVILCSCVSGDEHIRPYPDAEDVSAVPDASGDMPEGPEATDAPELSEAEKQFWKSAEKLLDYYEEVALRSEYGDADGKVHKWAETVRLYIRPSDGYEKYKEFYENFIDTLNGIDGFPGIEFTADPDNASLTLRFVSAEELERELGQESEHMYGFARISWYNSSGEIFGGSIYIVREEDSSEADVKHTLAEETTQAAGLMNDSYRYENSIFYQGYSVTDSLSDEDVILLRMHYSGYISAGSDLEAVKAAVAALANS